MDTVREFLPYAWLMAIAAFLIYCFFRYEGMREGCRFVGFIFGVAVLALGFVMLTLWSVIEVANDFHK